MVSSVANAEHEARAFRTMAEQRLARLTEERQQILGRITDLQSKADALDTEIEHLRALITPQSRPPETSAPVQNVAVADLVIALLEELGEPMHYRDIEQELRKRGQAPGVGADPANALLARYFNDARLYRPRRGTYALRAWDKSAKSVGVKRRARRRA